MYHDIAANTKALCRVCMSPELEQPADLYDASTSVLPSLHEMLRLICAPVFEKPEADLLIPEMPTKVCLVCQNAVFTAYNLHQQCIETDRRLNELVALRWELQGPGGDEVVGDSEDPLAASSQEVTLSQSTAKEDEIPKQNCIPCDSEANNTCSGCGKTFKSRWYFVRHKNQGWCDIQATTDEPSPVPDFPAADRDHSSDGVGAVENNTLLNTDAVNMIKVETLEVMDQNDSDDLLQEATMDQHIECSKCGISFSSIRAHQNHVQAGNCQRTSTFPCSICGKIFDTYSRMRYHIYTHKERVACPQCDDTFRNRNGLLVHIKRKRCSGIKLRKTGQNVSQISQASSMKEQNQHVEQDQTQREETNESLVVEMPAPVGDTFAEVIKTVDMQCGENDRRLNELVALRWELQGPGVDEFVGDSEDPSTSSSQEVTLPLSAAKEDVIPKQNCIPCDSEADNTCSGCGKTFKSRWYYVRHKNQGWCDIQATTDELGSASDFPATDRDHSSDGVRPVENNSLLNTDAVNMIKVETLEVMDQNDSDDLLQEATMDQHIECSKCGISFSSIRAHQKHVQAGNCQRTSIYPCTICGKIFDTHSRMRYHIYTHRERVACPQCDDTFRNRNGLLVHIKRKRCSRIKLRKTRQNVSQISQASSMKEQNQHVEQDQTQREETKESLVVEMPAPAGGTFAEVIKGPRGDEFVGNSEDPSTSSSQEVTLSLSAAKEDEIPKQNCIPCDSEADNTCSGCGKTFKSRWYYVRHKNQGWCDIQATTDELGSASNFPASDRDHSSDGVRPVENNSLLNTDAVNMIKVETLEVMDQNDSDDLLQEATIDQFIECSKCGISFSSIRVHRDHVQAGNCQRTSTYPCRFCGKIFDKQSRLQYHMYTHKERVACPHCDDTFRNRNGLSVHIRRKRCSGIKLRKEEQDGSQEELETQNEHASSTKEQEHHVEQDQTQREESLVVEIAAMEGDALAEVKKTVDMQCADCGVTFLSSRAHKMHVQEGNCQQKPTYPCKICGKIFDTLSRMTYHYYTHKERFPCSMCNAKFRSETSLRKHLKQKSCSEEYLRCPEMGSSPTEDEINDPLIEQTSVTDGSSTSGAFGDPLLNSAALEIIKVEETEIAEAQGVETQDVELHSTESQDAELQGVEPEHVDLQDKIELKSRIFVEQIAVTKVKKTCQLCSKTYGCAAVLRLHMKRIHQLYMCGVCRETFETEQMLEDHSKTNHVVVTVNCSNCEKSFPSQRALKRHRKDCESYEVVPDQTPKPFSCDLCEKKFESAVQLAYHKNNHGRVFCHQCGHCWRSKGELRKHIARGKCRGDKARTCLACKKLFETAAEYKKHRQEAHPGPVDCQDCGRKQPSLIAFYVHVKEGRCENIRNRLPKGVYSRTCQICGDVQASVSLLKSHMKANHPDQFYSCASCLRYYSSQKKLDIHMEKHSKNLVNICQTCKISFPSVAALKRHYFMHVGPSNCTVCQKSFTSKSSLKMHMTIHTGQKTYACGLCPKRFRTSLGRKQHLKSHSNEPAAAVCVCDVCGMKFTSTQTLKIHKMTIHEGLRPFACTKCDQKFGRPQHLRRHMLTHTNEKPFKCAICPHAYAESSELVKHVAREHGDGNPYACDRCDKTFRFIAELRKHYADHYQAGDTTAGVEEIGWNSMALLNMRFAKEKQQQNAEDGEDSE